MRRSRSQARVIAYAMPKDHRHLHTLWAVAAGLLTSIAIYAIAAMIRS